MGRSSCVVLVSGCVASVFGSFNPVPRCFDLVLDCFACLGYVDMGLGCVDLV